MVVGREAGASVGWEVGEVGRVEEGRVLVVPVGRVEVVAGKGDHVLSVGLLGREAVGCRGFMPAAEEGLLRGSAWALVGLEGGRPAGGGKEVRRRLKWAVWRRRRAALVLCLPNARGSRRAQAPALRAPAPQSAPLEAGWAEKALARLVAAAAAWEPLAEALEACLRRRASVGRLAARSRAARASTSRLAGRMVALDGVGSGASKRGGWRREEGE